VGKGSRHNLLEDHIPWNGLLDSPNIKIAGDSKLLEFPQVVLSLLKGQSGCLDVGDHFNKNIWCFVAHTTSSNLRSYSSQLYGYIQHGPPDVVSNFVLSKYRF
jgi:hypothetical protein